MSLAADQLERTLSPPWSGERRKPPSPERNPGVAFPGQNCSIKAVPTPIPVGKKFCYGLGELGPAMAGSTLIFFQLLFLTDVAGLTAGLAGIVLLVGKAWDAVNDPLIGWLSDHTKTRWGRRLPWMVGSAVPFAASFALLWYVPPFLVGNQTGLFFYYVGIALLFNTAYTGLALTHTSLTPELSSDYDERSRITGFRMACSIGGSVGGLILAAVMFRIFAGSEKTVQFGALGGSVAAVGLGATAICVLGIWRLVIEKNRERLALAAQTPVDSTRPKPSIRKQIGILFSNRPFLIVCGIYLFSWLAMQFTATILPYYVQSWMRLPRETFNILALVVQGTALAMIPFWGWVSVQLGKKAAYFLAMPFWLAAQGGLLLLQPGASTLMFVLAVSAGLGISVCYLIPNAMLPDTIELDELKTGQRREGIFYGGFVFLQKLALALGTAVIGLALELAGYVSSGPGQTSPVQPESALTAIRFAIGPLPAISLVLGIILTALYPITKASHTETLRLLAQRRAGGV